MTRQDIKTKPRTLNAKRSKRVFVGMSGGVDSSVSAGILKRAGYDVTGVFIKVWRPDFLECTWRDDRLDAMRVAVELDIPFITLDLEKEYKKEVVDYMVREYKLGRIPNPDVFCNRYIKFGAFYDFAMKNGADFVATGHYAKIGYSGQRLAFSRGKKFSNPNPKRYTLNASRDSAKDQTYFLWGIKKETLPKIIFPVGDMTKTEVRKLAKKFGLFTAEKKDSQGLCFVGKIDLKDFLGRLTKTRKGDVFDDSGAVIGEHDGAFLYTLGQRHGFKIKAKTSNENPFYVISKNIKENSITVGNKKDGHEVGNLTKMVFLSDTNWFGEIPANKELKCRFRYQQKLIACKLMKKDEKTACFKFRLPQNSVACGQSLVVYDGDVCLGGGIIEKSL